LQTHLLFDEMSWPNPQATGDLEWDLRYGQPTKNDLLMAASVVSAYRALFEKPTSRSSEIIRTIKRMLREDRNENV
jgi:hypothetical protein